MTDFSERLKKAREGAGFDSVGDAAESLGIKYPTYAAHENGSRKPDIDQAKRYAQRFRVTVQWLLTGKDKEKVLPLDFLPVTGKVSAGLPQPVESIETDSLFEMIPASSDYPSEWQFAMEVEGESLNKIAPNGSRLVCLSIDESGYSVQDGDLVIVERRMFDGQAIERTAKRIRKTSQGFDLWPESNSEEHQKPIPINGNEDSEEYSVRAVVLWILTRPRKA